MEPVRLKEGVYWVGGIDWKLRNFHGYSTGRGSTYNAYLIIDEKITLIDTVKEYLFDEMMERISKVIDPSKIDIIISNHVEMDHSGSLPKIMQVCPSARIYASPNGVRGLKAHYRKAWDFVEVKGGDTLSLGKRSLQFLLTPMVHWPDNMVSFCPEEKILFSNDSFGQHIASSERFDDEFPADIIWEEAAKYYANIVWPYSAQVRKELEAASALDFEMIAPSHGLVIRSLAGQIVGLYQKWAALETIKKAVVVYDTMWKSTEKMAFSIASAFEAKGYKVRLMSLQENHISDIMTELLDARTLCVGSPTLNNNMLPTVAAFLTYLKGLSCGGREALAFGSYGWGGQSI
ncbi:MAG TPA: FprA family A-type flavoprotein, partial [Candidatus Mcinerneyibacteriales bacterium]|nr:FprA family A-type flavoprotein [Candidatus Mcinerneyibacteriales bacterium]